jgi:hypothetical protein
MRRILALIGITTLCVYIGFVCWDFLSLRLGVYGSIVAPAVQIPWTMVAIVGMAIAHKGRAALLMVGIVAVIVLYRLRHKFSN